MSSPIISIIVPVYNSASYLEAAIDSLQKQTCEKIEILLIDDGSTDGSLERIHAVCARNDHFYYLSLEWNCGLSAAMKAGIDAALEAKADIVVLCSSDDEYAQYAPEAFKLLDGRALFVVAGAPACMDDLKAQGITEFIHVRSNVLDTLRSFNEKLSI